MAARLRPCRAATPATAAIRRTMSMMPTLSRSATHPLAPTATTRKAPAPTSARVGFGRAAVVHTRTPTAPTDQKPLTTGVASRAPSAYSTPQTTDAVGSATVRPATVAPASADRPTDHHDQSAGPSVAEYAALSRVARADMIAPKA